MPAYAPTRHQASARPGTLALVVGVHVAVIAVALAADEAAATSLYGGSGDDTYTVIAGATINELANEGIPVTLNADSAAAHIMKTKGVTWVIVGADRITANGDVANKIGTYQLAVNAMHHGVRFMVVAPSSTLDLMMATGEDVALEERDPGELLEVMGQHLEVNAFNPVFDVTPADLIDVIVTEKGVVERPDTAKLARLMCRKRLH